MASTFPVKIRIRAASDISSLRRTTAELRRMSAAAVSAGRALKTVKSHNRAGSRFGGISRGGRSSSGFPVAGGGGGAGAVAAAGGVGGQRTKTERRINQAAVLGGVSSSLGRISRQSAAAFSGPIRAAAEFEKVMVSTGAKTGATADKVEELTAQARKLGADARFQFSATEVGGAQGFLAQAGFEVDQIKSSIRSTLDLGAASGEDLGFSSDFLSDVTKSFGAIGKDTSLEGVQTQMQRFADVSVRTTNTSNTNLRQLAGSLLTVGPVARGAGQDLEQVAGAVGTLANAGIKGNKAGTDLRNVFLRLSAPTKGAKKALASIGLDQKDLLNAKGNLMGIVSVFNILDSALEKTFGPENKASKSAVFDALFGKRTTASGFVLAEAARSGDLATQINRGRTSRGAAADVAKLKAGTTAGKLKAARAQLESLQIELGNQFVPVLLAAVEVLTPFVAGLGKFIKSNPGLTRTVGTILFATTALSGVLAAAAGVATVTLATRAAMSALSGASTATGTAATTAAANVGKLGKAFSSAMGVMTAAVAGFAFGKVIDRLLDISGRLAEEDETDRDSGTVRGFASKSEEIKKDINLARSLEKDAAALRSSLDSETTDELIGSLAIMTNELADPAVSFLQAAADRQRVSDEIELGNVSAQLAAAKGRISAAQQREERITKHQEVGPGARSAEAESLELLIKVEDARIKARKGRRTTKKADVQVETGRQTEGI